MTKKILLHEKLKWKILVKDLDKWKQFQPMIAFALQVDIAMTNAWIPVSPER